MRRGSVLVVADESEIAHAELPVTVLPVLSTPVAFAPISVIAKSPMVVPDETIRQ